MIHLGSREYYVSVLLQAALLLLALTYLFFLFLGDIHFQIAALFSGTQLATNLLTRCWIATVVALHPARVYMFLWLAFVLAFIVYLLLKYFRHPRFLLVLSLVNFLVVNLGVFLTLTAYSHVVQMGSSMDHPPYWPYLHK